jgi:hypothetical protein
MEGGRTSLSIQPFLHLSTPLLKDVVDDCDDQIEATQDHDSDDEVDDATSMVHRDAPLLLDPVDISHHPPPGP